MFPKLSFGRLSEMSPPVRRREIWSWGLYDFANSAFATTILAVIFATYFSSAIVPKEGVIFLGLVLKGPVLWNLIVSGSLGLVCLTAPAIGAITDYTASKKKFLLVFWLMGCLATAALSLMGPGMVLPAIIIFVLANIGFSAGNPIYNAFLTELAPPEKRSRISSFGWGIGYIGGGLCLAVNLGMINIWGVENAVRPGFLVVAVWWFVFALPLFICLRERAVPKPPVPRLQQVRRGVQEVFQTLRHIRQYRELFKFLLAFLLFNEGVQTIIVNSAIYGKRVIGMKEEDLILVYLMVQAVAFAGAFLLGKIAERFRTKPTLLYALVVWLAVLVFAFQAQTPGAFWILGAMVGLVMGGTQALSRGFFGELTPEGKSAEFFGFYALGGRFSAAIGPLVFGLLVYLTGGMRWGIASTGIFFIAGFLLLLTVSEKRGREEAQAAEKP